MVNKVEEIKKVVCLGGGVIGSSWAITFAMHGLDVVLRDLNDELLEKARTLMNKSLDSLEEYNAITREKREDILSHITMTTSIEEALKDAEFVQENGPERIEIKRSILAEVDKYAPDAIYASSTSGLLVTDIAAESSHPERCVGAHPYNPPHLIPLVEITKGEKTDEKTVELVYAFYQSIGKEAVYLKKECPGYIANRLQLAIYREMIDLVMRGVCSVEDVDKAMVYGPGIRWAVFGHNMIMELGNPDGFLGMVAMLGKAGDAWLADMAKWTEMPDITGFDEGIKKEMASFPEFMGNDHDSCAKFRDQALIEILKIHHKF
ncbi:MAG: 3-hydroxyacyl-CoA dehydrogenase family protein [Anaerovoracaceae bacterium]